MGSQTTPTTSTSLLRRKLSRQRVDTTPTDQFSAPPPALLGLHSAIVLAAILILAVGVRLVMATHAPAFISPTDSVQFLAPGYELVQGGEFDLPLKRAPLYAAFLAAMMASLGPSLEAIALVQHLLGLATVVLAYVVGTLAFGRGTGLVAAFATAVNGALLLMERTILSEALFAPLQLAGVCLVLLALRSGRRRDFFLAGLVVGLAALTRPILQAFLPLVVAVVLVQPWSRRPRLAAAGLLCCGYLLVTVPWIARNSVVHGVAGISGGLGEALFARTYRHDRGFIFRDRAKRGPDPQQASIRARIFELARDHRTDETDLRRTLRAEFGLSQARIDSALREVALQVIRQQPERYVQGTLAMFAHLGLDRLDEDDELRLLWKSRARKDYPDTWPEPVRSAMESTPPGSAEDLAIVDAVTGHFRDFRLGVLGAVLFLLGSLRCLAAGRRGLLLLPLLVLTQLFLYVAVDGLLLRYRTPLQPLIAIIMAGGFTLLLTPIWTWVAQRASAPLRLVGWARSLPAR